MVTSGWIIYCRLVCCYLLLNNCCWALAYGHGKCHCFTHRVLRNLETTRRRRVSRCRRSTQQPVCMKGSAYWNRGSATNQWVSTSGHVFEFICSYSTICLCICIPVTLCLFPYFNRYKNVIFEISPSEVVGVFDVKAKLMGVHLETLMLEYQVKVLLLIFLVSVSHASQKDVCFVFKNFIYNFGHTLF